LIALYLDKKRSTRIPNWMWVCYWRRDSSFNLVPVLTEKEGRVEGACDEEQARNTSRALPGSEKESGESSAEVEYDKTSIPLMETNPPLRAPSPPRRAGRQFVRVYPTYPDISTLRPGVGSDSQSSADLSLAPLSYSYPRASSLLSFAACIPLVFSLTSFLPSICPFSS